jgi:hypothetical protein
MRRGLFILMICVAWMKPAFAQYSITTANRNIQFSGYLTTFWNHRFYAADETDRSKNRMNLDFAVLRVQTANHHGFRSEIQLNFPAIYSTDPTDEFLMQATTEWRNKKGDFSAQAGYDKLPFSWASMMPQNESAFMQRAECVRGKTFNRRDLGVTLTKGFLNRRLVATVGVYTGEGINSITGDNDPNGKFLYAARLEGSYPSRYRNEEIDVNHTRKVRVKVGADVLYTEKTQTTGTDYPILTVDGRKTSQSADVTASWRGFSAHAEWIRFRIAPNDTSVLLGKPTNYFLAQGVIAQCAYHSKKLNSIFSIRYDEFNPNDLIIGDNRETISLAYNYLFDGMDQCIKVHYFHRLQADGALDPWTENQIRIGWQMRF